MSHNGGHGGERPSPCPTTRVSFGPCWISEAKRQAGQERVIRFGSREAALDAGVRLQPLGDAVDRAPRMKTGGVSESLSVFRSAPMLATSFRSLISPYSVARDARNHSRCRLSSKEPVSSAGYPARLTHPEGFR
jgi:hypothetical protein